LSKSVSIPLR